jgi:glycosyltransferase involved in cell wall biosynthesis
MGKRTKIGIIYSYNENWIGGTYYYQNLIRSFHFLPDHKKPHIVILTYYEPNFDSIKELNYPFISYELLNKKPNTFENYSNRILQKIFPQRDFMNKNVNFGIDVLFHQNEVNIPDTIKTHLYWIPDFQEVHLPHLFSKDYLELRKKSQLKLLSDKANVLFSSDDAFNDFKKLYPIAKSKTFVVNFSVFHPDFLNLDFQKIKDKYKLGNAPYFFAPNQFWKHKNHMIILKAVKKLKKDFDIKFQIVFSGKESDPRNPSYFNDLKAYIEEHDLQTYFNFLGFIDRGDQLCLMNNTLAVIQPSLFEGWSTVVEDAKAMNQNVMASSLNVHKEQLGDKAYFFDTNNEDELMDHILFFLNNAVERPEFNYTERLKSFGENFMEVIVKIKG